MTCQFLIVQTPQSVIIFKLFELKENLPYRHTNYSQGNMAHACLCTYAFLMRYSIDVPMVCAIRTKQYRNDPGE